MYVIYVYVNMSNSNEMIMIMIMTPFFLLQTCNSHNNKNFQLSEHLMYQFWMLR